MPAPGILIDGRCDIKAADDAIAARRRCARLQVLRDPDNPDDGRFEFAVVIRRSADPKPDAAAMLFPHGGPGGQITRCIGRRTNAPVPGHDVVASGMRGGGRSTLRVCDGADRRVSRPPGPDGGACPTRVAPPRGP